MKQIEAASGRLNSSSRNVIATSITKTGPAHMKMQVRAHIYVHSTTDRGVVYVQSVAIASLAVCHIYRISVRADETTHSLGQNAQHDFNI